MKQVARLREILRQFLGLGHRIFVADDGREARNQIGRQRRLREFWPDDRHVHQPFGAAARRNRSLMASPSPSSGIGITAMVRAPLVSKARRQPKKIGRSLLQISAFGQIYHSGSNTN